MNAVDEVRQLLGGLDPARDGGPGDEERRARDLARILASDRAVGAARRTVPRRRLVLAAGAVVLAVAAGGVALEMAREPQPAYAPTPAIFTYGPPASAEPAGIRLRRLAEVAAGQPALERPAGTVEHLESANWSTVPPREWWSTSFRRLAGLSSPLCPSVGARHPGTTTRVVGPQLGPGALGAQRHPPCALGTSSRSAT